jgi:hypothetical protein
MSGHKEATNSHLVIVAGFLLMCGIMRVLTQARIERILQSHWFMLQLICVVSAHPGILTSVSCMLHVMN